MSVINFDQEVKKVEKHMDILNAIVRDYKSLDTIASLLLFSPNVIAAYFVKEKVPFPPTGALLQALRVMDFTAKNPMFQTAEEVEATTEVYVVKSRTDDIVAEHVRVDRSTQKMEFCSADTIGQMARQFEDTKPGITTFLGEIFNLFNMTGGRMVPWGDQAMFDKSKVAPQYNYAGLATFCQMYGPTLAPAKPPSNTIIFPLVVNNVARLTLQQFLDMQTHYYELVRNLKRGPRGFELYVGEPLEQVGKAVVAGKPFFQHYPEIRNKNFHIRRVGPWSVTLPEVLTTKSGLDQLAADRAWRGEDRGRYSSLTTMHSEGGNLTKTRKEVCAVLSIILPLLHKDVHVLCEPKSAAHIGEIYKAAQFYIGPNPPLAFKATSQELYQCFGDKYAELEPRPDIQYHFVSTKSSAAPTFTKKEDPEKKWMTMFPPTVPKGKFTVVLKVPPAAAKDYNVFLFGSAHAFDFLVSSESHIWLAARSAVVGGDKLITSYYEYDPPRQNPTQLRQRQYADDRRKLAFFLEMRGHRVADRMNLWILTPKAVAMRQGLLMPTVERSTKLRPTDDFDNVSQDQSDSEDSEDSDSESESSESEPAPPKKKKHAAKTRRNGASRQPCDEAHVDEDAPETSPDEIDPYVSDPDVSASKRPKRKKQKGSNKTAGKQPLLVPLENFG